MRLVVFLLCFFFILPACELKSPQPKISFKSGIFNVLPGKTTRAELEERFGSPKVIRGARHSFIRVCMEVIYNNDDVVSTVFLYPQPMSTKSMKGLGLDYVEKYSLKNVVAEFGSDYVKAIVSHYTNAIQYRELSRELTFAYDSYGDIAVIKYEVYD